MGLIPLGILASGGDLGCELLVSLRPRTGARRLHVVSTRNVAIVECNTADESRCRENGRSTRPTLSSEMTLVCLRLALLLNVNSDATADWLQNPRH
jgi:hypothetical protein